MRDDILNRKQEILQWVKQGQTKTWICEQLSCRHGTLNNFLFKFNIEYAGNQGGKGLPDKSRKSAEEYIKSSCVKTHILRLKLIEDGIKEEKCEKCKRITWLGKKINLELHHKDGDRFNNNFENLEILCPNCHSMTDNYGSKNNK